MTISEAEDLAGESAATFASMVAFGDDAVAWFDDVYESVMARLIRKELAKGK
jgi:hypothetical protein